MSLYVLSFETNSGKSYVKNVRCKTVRSAKKRARDIFIRYVDICAMVLFQKRNGAIYVVDQVLRKEGR